MTTPKAIQPILDVSVHPTSYAEATERIISWAKAKQAKSVYAANVHMIMEGVDDPAFKALINQADLVTPDGMPLVWALRRLGAPGAKRVYGPTLMLHVLQAAEAEGLNVGLYGSQPHVLDDLKDNLEQRYPELNITYAYAPPFRPLSEDEDAAVINDIKAANVHLLFVGLGCPRQEKWVANHRDKLDLVQLAVGAAFDFHAGHVKQAPAAMQNSGLEWLYRLSREPGRLFKRYAKHNPRFVFFLSQQLLRNRG